MLLQVSSVVMCAYWERHVYSMCTREGGKSEDVTRRLQTLNFLLFRDVHLADALRCRSKIRPHTLLWYDKCALKTRLLPNPTVTPAHAAQGTLTK